MAHPDDIDPVHRRDFVNGGDTGGGFDQGDDQGALVRRRDLVRHRAGLVIVMRHAESGAAPLSAWRMTITRPALCRTRSRRRTSAPWSSPWSKPPPVSPPLTKSRRWTGSMSSGW